MNIEPALFCNPLLMYQWPLEIIKNISQCSTLVSNTVVRAILQAYGKWWWGGAKTGEPIEMKLGMGDYVGDPTPHAQKRKVYVKGGRLGVGVGVKCSTQACLFFFFSSFWFPERTSSLTGKDWLGALCTQKRVLVVIWFLGGEMPKKVQRPHFRG